MFFFFKQKTAYEMRISDWSSDVCSSDLLVLVAARLQAGDEVREVGHRAQLVGKLAAHAVEVRADADVVDADQLDRVVDLVEHRVDMRLPRRVRFLPGLVDGGPAFRSEEHTSELQSLMRISYAVFCLKK